jgi:hypothetical protein
MRQVVMTLTVVTSLMLIVPSFGFSQAKPQGTFDPHDLTGPWLRTGGNYDVGGEVPPMTAEGEKRLFASKPSYGRPLGAPLNGEHVGRVRAVPPALGNDIVGACNPSGVPRLLWYVEPFEFIAAPDKVVQFFSWERAVREIWTDGRRLPTPQALANLGPRWYGYSVGRWEGDTLVVDSLGYDDRTWLDHLGYPRSDQMSMQERYRRISPDMMELEVTITDPKLYTKPWVAGKHTYTIVPREQLVFEGWGGFLEGICAPLDEHDFNDRVRNPAGGVTEK